MLYCFIQNMNAGSTELISRVMRDGDVCHLSLNLTQLRQFKANNRIVVFDYAEK